jgi:hypothetical protein
VIVSPAALTGNVHLEMLLADQVTWVPIECAPGADLIAIAAAGAGWIFFGFPYYAIRIVSDAAEAAQRDFTVLYQGTIASPG